MILLLKKFPDIRKRGFAAVYDSFQASMEPRIAEYRQRTAGQATGDVLEIGGGTGSNLPFYPQDARLTVVEPNPHMARRLQRKADDVGRPVTIVSDIADTLPFPDGSFDSVVSTLVLCSVAELETELDEIRRVLRPGGVFYFFEHVAASGPWKRRFQDWFNSPNKFIADGCNLNRDIASSLLEVGFSSTDITPFELNLGNPLTSSLIIGHARA